VIDVSAARAAEPITVRCEWAMTGTRSGAESGLWDLAGAVAGGAHAVSLRMPKFSGKLGHHLWHVVKVNTLAAHGKEPRSSLQRPPTLAPSQRLTVKHGIT
jgi:hypothetical protein